MTTYYDSRPSILFLSLTVSFFLSKLFYPYLRLLLVQRRDPVSIVLSSFVPRCFPVKHAIVQKYRFISNKIIVLLNYTLVCSGIQILEAEMVPSCSAFLLSSSFQSNLQLLSALIALRRSTFHFDTFTRQYSGRLPLASPNISFVILVLRLSRSIHHLLSPPLLPHSYPPLTTLSLCSTP